MSHFAAENVFTIFIYDIKCSANIFFNPLLIERFRYIDIFAVFVLIDLKNKIKLNFFNYQKI